MEDELIELRGKLEITELFVQQVKSIHALVIKLYLYCLIKCVVCFFHIPAHMNQLCSSSPVPAANNSSAFSICAYLFLVFFGCTVQPFMYVCLCVVFLPYFLPLFSTALVKFVLMQLTLFYTVV